MSLPIIKIKLLKRKSLLAIIENSIKGGDNYFFRNLYAKDEDGQEIDILENGLNSCAVFVSWILLTLELIKHPHTYVGSTEKDLIESGWQEVKDLKPGAVIIWEPKPGTKPLLNKYDIEHNHIGFFVGNNMAVSNDSKIKGFPHKHHYTYNGARKIEKIYWHPKLDEE